MDGEKTCADETKINRKLWPVIITSYVLRWPVYCYTSWPEATLVLLKRKPLSRSQGWHHCRIWIAFVMVHLMVIFAAAIDTAQVSKSKERRTERLNTQPVTNCEGDKCEFYKTTYTFMTASFCCFFLKLNRNQNGEGGGECMSLLTALTMFLI